MDSGDWGDVLHEMQGDRHLLASVRASLPVRARLEVNRWNLLPAQRAHKVASERKEGILRQGSHLANVMVKS